jgi:hypothetical protein
VVGPFHSRLPPTLLPPLKPVPHPLTHPPSPTAPTNRPPAPPRHPTLLRHRTPRRSPRTHGNHHHHHHHHHQPPPPPPPAPPPPPPPPPTRTTPPPPLHDKLRYEGRPTPAHAADFGSNQVPGSPVGGGAAPEYGDAPPSYEDAIADRAGPVTAPRPTYVPPAPAEDPLLGMGDEKKGWGG